MKARKSTKAAAATETFIAIGTRKGETQVALFPGILNGKQVTPTQSPRGDEIDGLASLDLDTPINANWKPFDGAGDCARLWVGERGTAVRLLTLAEALKRKLVRRVDCNGKPVVAPVDWNPAADKPRKYLGSENPVHRGRIENERVSRSKGRPCNVGDTWGDIKAAEKAAAAKPAKPKRTPRKKK